MNKEETITYSFKKKKEIYNDFSKLNEKTVRHIINSSIALVSGVSLKEARDRKIVYPKEVEKIYSLLS